MLSTLIIKFFKVQPRAPPCGKQADFIVKTSDDTSLMVAGYPICACFCPLKQSVFMAAACSLGYFRSVTTLSVCTVEKRWEGAGTTEEDHDSRCSLQGFEPEISRIPKTVFYHYKIRIVVTVCYTWNTNEVQRIIYVRQNFGE